MADRTNDLAILAVQAFRGTNRIISPDTVAKGLLGLRDAKGAPVMSDVELRNPLEFLLLNQLAAVVRARLLPADVLRPKDNSGTPSVNVKADASHQPRRAPKHKPTREHK